MGDVTIFDYRLKNGKKKYGYRFEMASVNGTRKWKDKRGFNTKTEAQKAGRTAQVDYERRGYLLEPSNMSYEDLFQKWLATASIKDTTRHAYEKAGRLYISPKIGHLKISTIVKDDLRTLLADMINRGFAQSTLFVVKGLLTKTFEFAVDEKYLLESPAANLRMPKIERPDVPQRTAPHSFITKEEMEIIFERFPFGHQYHFPLMFGYTCGLRIGEAFALTWDNINFATHMLTVDKQVQRYCGKSKPPGVSIWYLSAPKYSSARTISIPDSLYVELEEEYERQKIHRKKYGEYYSRYYINSKKEINQDGNGDEVFFITVREDGSYVTTHTMLTATKIIHDELGVEHFDFHSLRHTHATMLAESGAPANYVSKRLGHKNVSTTIDTYYHLTDDIRRQGDNFLNEKF